MPIINPRIRFIEKFLARFNSVFSTQHQRSIFREFIYAIILAIISAYPYTISSRNGLKKAEKLTKS